MVFGGKMSKQAKQLLVLAVVFVLALGCGLSGKVEPTVDTAGGEATTAPEVSPTQDVGGGESGGEDEIAASDISGSLEGLDSYRMRFTMTFEGTDGDGETVQSTLEMEVEYVRDPFAMRVAISGSDEDIGLAGETMEMVQIGDQQYTVFEGQCMVTPADESFTDMGLFETEDLLSDIESAHRVMPDETVNGVACRHYKFDEQSTVGFSSANGEIWVAVDGNYLVKYTLEADGKNPINDEEGHVEWVYELRDINAPITIEPPAGCESVGSEFPMMPDATNVMMMEGTVMYESASAFDDVLAFYQDEMVAAGWTSEDSFVGEGVASLTYTKDGRTATVMLSAGDDVVSVVISAE
jgi:outer membrane lipoprotein-sorting protein